MPALVWSFLRVGTLTTALTVLVSVLILWLYRLLHLT
jgi:hypothetical protein